MNEADAKTTTPGRDEPSAALRQIVDRLWLEPARAAGRPLATTWGHANPGPGHTLIEEYVVYPNAASARFVSPRLTGTAGLRALLAYNRLRGRKTRLLRTVTGVVAMLRLDWLVRATPLRIWAHPAGQWETPAPTLREWLAEAAGDPTASISFGVHELDPNYKPTLTVLDGRGRPLAFAKIGWSAPTARLVRTEGESMAEHSDRLTGTVRSPRLLRAGQWAGLETTVVTPMPPDVRGYLSTSPPPEPALEEVTGRREFLPLRETPWWSRVTAAIEAGLHPSVAETCGRYAAALAAVDEPVSVGTWHGDWVPWNLAVRADELYVFDWEHSAVGVPFGFDLAHWAFQVALVLQGRPANVAVAAADASTSVWGRAGVEVARPRLVVSAYLLEMALRTERLQRDGAGWNPSLFPDLYDVLERRRYESVAGA